MDKDRRRAMTHLELVHGEGGSHMVELVKGEERLTLREYGPTDEGYAHAFDFACKLCVFTDYDYALIEASSVRAEHKEARTERQRAATERR